MRRMSEKEASKAKTLGKPQPLNEEVMRGVWIDGIGLGLSSDYIILDGIITPPRSDKPYVVARLLFPPRLLEHLAKNFTDAVRKQKELKPAQVAVETKIE
jgi:hypothetical protein